jgi:phage-related protein
MITLKSALDSLPSEQRRQLMYAFEHRLTQYVPLSDNEFLGVNVGGIKHLEVRQAAGVWAYGIDKSKEKANE